MKKAIAFLSGICQILCLQAQQIEIIAQHEKTSFRGLSIADGILWVSGSGGTVGSSADYGKSWKWQTIKGYENIEFRDIEAIDRNTAIVMGIASPAYILKTTDGGNSWKKVYENNDSNIFLDAMAFKNKKEGLVIGDPMNNEIFVAQTTDGGDSWQPTPFLALPKTVPGEAFFAASGTNIIWSEKKGYCIVSGGSQSRFFNQKKSTLLPTTKGQQMTGANGISMNGNTILIASGNYNNLNKADSAFVYSHDGGSSWHLPATMPSGYRSAVCFIDAKTAITCGITGVDISNDRGVHWKKISTEGFNNCAYNKQNQTVYFVGNNGRVGKLEYHTLHQSKK